MNHVSPVWPLLAVAAFSLFGEASGARPASPDDQARVALALAQAAVRVKASALASAPVKILPPAPPARGCPCSDQCSCGCVEGEPCRCPRAILPSARATPYPAFPPSVSGGRNGC